MSKRSWIVAALVAVLVVAAPVLAQGRGLAKGRGIAVPPHAVARTTHAGEVVALDAEPGRGAAQLEIRTDSGEAKTFVLGPRWFVARSGFDLQPGDRVEVDTLYVAGCAYGAAAAEIRDLGRSTTLTLRNEDGVPVWSGGPGGGRCRRGRGGNGLGCDAQGPDMTRAETFEGTVVSFRAEPGAGLPTLVLSTGAAERSVVVSPFRILRSSGVQLTSGQRLAVHAAPAPDASHWVAIEVRDLGGAFDLRLRDPETGRPY